MIPNLIALQQTVYEHMWAHKIKPSGNPPMRWVLKIKSAVCFCFVCCHINPDNFGEIIPQLFELSYLCNIVRFSLSLLLLGIINSI